MVRLSGIARRIAESGLSGSEHPFRLTDLESLAVAQVEPALTEMTRSGHRFHGGLQVLTDGIAPVQAIPTTTAALALYNSSQEKSLVIEQIGFFLADGTAAAGATLLAAVGSRAAIASPPAANAAGYSSQVSHGLATATYGIWTKGLTFPNTPSWFQVQSYLQAAAANLGQGESPVEIAGAIIVPPLKALGLAVLSGVGTTPLYGISARWCEIKLSIEQ